MAATPGKDTIYIDIDDEITTVIEKLRASDEKIVALVLPKRATVFQSIVNMKLLKRSAENAKKHVVLITSEAGLLPMAGSVGLLVAKNLQSKPEIPGTAAPLVITGDSGADLVLDDADDVEAADFNAETASATPIGELADGAGVTAGGADDAIETLQLDDDLPVAVSATESSADNKAATVAKPKKDRKLAIPSFNKFRLGLGLAALFIIVIGVGIYFATVVLPKATVTITTDTSDVNSSLSLNFDTAAKTLDTKKLIVPAQTQKIQKNGSQQVATTGKKNNGDKASGTVTASQTCTKKPPTVPSGTGFGSAGLIFITQEDLNLVPSGTDSQGNFICSGSVPVTAQSAGASYNLAANSKFTYGTITATNSNALTGGTDNIVQIVAQADVDNATQKITVQNSDTVKQQLTTQLKQVGLMAIASTFAAGTPNTTTSAKVGDEAATVTVTESTNYTMFGVKEADLKTLVDNDVKGKIDPAKQSILSEGLAKAGYRLTNATDTTAQVALTTTATAGPDLQTDAIKTAIAGKKSGDIKSLLKADPGVTKVDVSFSPFWVSKAPSKLTKLTVTFVKATP